MSQNAQRIQNVGRKLKYILNRNTRIIYKINHYGSSLGVYLAVDGPVGFEAILATERAGHLVPDLVIAEFFAHWTYLKMNPF